MSESLHKYWDEIQDGLFVSENRSLEVFDIISKRLSEKGRFYHNQTHIEDLLVKQEAIDQLLINKIVFKMAIWFHDIIYNPLKSNNEEKSAKLAMDILADSNILEKDLNLMSQFIIATKSHQLIISHHDLPYFLDLDLSILGTSTEQYKAYMAQIRKEYRHVPGMLYKKGRQKVLKSFLDRKEIYFSDYFKKLYEEKARENLKFEIHYLS